MTQSDHHRLLDAVKLWSPQFGRRLDELAGPEYWKLRSADEIRQAAQQRQRAGIMYDHPTSVAVVDGKEGTEIAAGVMADADEAADAEIPNPLRNDLARLLRDWGRWDDKDRVVNATELAGRLVIEKTRRGQPHRLEYAPLASPGDWSADYRPVGQARHDALGPYDLDLRNSTIRDPGGWLPVRIFVDTTAETARAREISAATTSQSAEWRAPDQEPTYSLTELCRSWADVTGEAWQSILYRFGDWAITDAFPDDAFLDATLLSANRGDTTFHKKIIFDRVQWHRGLVEKIRGVQDPNEKARLQLFADTHMKTLETAVMRRDVFEGGVSRYERGPATNIGPRGGRFCGTSGATRASFTFAGWSVCSRGGSGPGVASSSQCYAGRRGGGAHAPLGRCGRDVARQRAKFGTELAPPHGCVLAW